MVTEVLSRAMIHFGRVLLSSLFILGGANKLMNLEATASTMTEIGFPFVSLLLPATIVLELGGGLAVAFGRRGAMLAALTLAAYTMAVNLIFHNFWDMVGEIAQVELSLFFKNISVIGGLLFVAGCQWSCLNQRSPQFH